MPDPEAKRRTHGDSSPLDPAAATDIPARLEGFDPGVESGDLIVEGIDRPVVYFLGMETDSELSPEHPAVWKSPNDGKCYMVFIHESVPNDLLELVLVHELAEISEWEIEVIRDYARPGGMESTRTPTPEAHNFADAVTIAYARAYLGEDAVERFLEYRRKLNAA